MQKNPNISSALPADAAVYQSGLRKWLPMLILSLALMIIVLDTTILNVSLKTIVNDLNTDIEGIQWVITAYSLTLAAFTITGGRLGDLFGRKRMFVIGAVIFAVGSFITSISHSVGMMITGESVIEGVGAALMMPATASLLVSNYKGRDRAIAFGFWGGMAAAASALGPIVGGFLTTHYSWRWAFRINIFVAIALLLGSLLIAEARDREEKQELDFVGVILSALGLLALVFGIIESATHGWWHAKKTFTLFGHGVNPFGLSITPVSIAVGLVLLVLFGLWQRRLEAQGHTPLVSLKIFQNKQFTAGAAVTAMLSLGQIGTIFALPVFLQSVQNLDALHTGLALLPMSLTLMVAAPLSAVISKYVTPKRIVQAGLAINVLATVIIHQSITVTTTPLRLAPGLMLFGVGIGLVMAQVSNLTLSAVSVQEAGEASGVNNTFRQIGSSFGSAIIGAALVATLTASLSSGVKASPVIPEAQKPAIAQAVSSAASSVEFGGVRQESAHPLPPAVEQELSRIAKQASTDGSRRAIVFTTIFSFLGFLLAGLLPNVKNVERNESVASKAVH
jgi:EmrB/QacA subfamily drug resistance transporter